MFRNRQLSIKSNNYNLEYSAMARPHLIQRFPPLPNEAPLASMIVADVPIE